MLKLKFLTKIAHLEWFFKSCFKKILFFFLLQGYLFYRGYMQLLFIDVPKNNYSLIFFNL